MKTLTAAAQASLATKLATEPTILVQVDWDSGTGYYADKDLTLGSDDYEGRIISLSAIDHSTRLDDLSGVSSVTVALDDTDTTVLPLLNTDTIVGTKIRVYQHLEGNADGDKALLLDGTIAGDPTWDEGNRVVSFEAQSGVSDQLIGYAPTQADLTWLNPAAEGVMWPLCFGKPLRVPAVPVEAPIAGKCEIVYPATMPGSTVTVTNGAQFTQGTSVSVAFVGGTKWWSGLQLRSLPVRGRVAATGVFTGDQFACISYNDPLYTNVAFASRPVGEDDPSIAWITDATIRLAGQFCYIANGTPGDPAYINYCYKQEGTKCWFRKPWHFQGSTGGLAGIEDLEMPTATYTQIDEVRGLPTTDWRTSVAPSSIYDIHDGRYVTEALDTAGNLVVEESAPTAESTFPAWTTYNPTVLEGPNDQAVYVVNDMASDAVLEVMSERPDLGLSPVPSSYYTVDLANTTLVPGKTVTSITFNLPLSLFAGSFSDTIYVSVDSSQGNNSAEQIKYILDTYSGLDTDTASFASVATDVTNYIANYAILKQSEAIRVAADIAWQSRCALRMSDGLVGIVYLSKATATTQTYDASNVLLKSFETVIPAPEDLVTRLTGLWQADYATDEDNYYYTNNADTYGLKPADRKMWIYNIEQLVKYSIGFWGYRYSNAWRRAKFSGTLDTLATDVLDTNSVNLADFSPNEIRGLVTEQSHDTSEHTFSYQIELASRTGDHSSGALIEDTAYWSGDPSNTVSPSNPMPNDPATGRAQQDYPIYPEGEADDEDDKWPQWQVVLPESVNRGTAFDITVVSENESGTINPVSGSATLSFSGSDASDTLSVSSITVSGGVGTASATISGGSGSATCQITCSGLNTLAGNGGTTVDASGKARFANFPDVIIRDNVFSVSITAGTPSASIDVDLTSTDSTGDTLADGSGSPLTSVTLDASGEYSGSWQLTGGADASSEAYATLTDAGNVSSSDPATVLELTSDAAFTIEVSATTTEPIGSLFVRTDSYNGASLGTWSRFEENAWLLNSRVRPISPYRQRTRLALGLLVAKTDTTFTLLLHGKYTVDFSLPASGVTIGEYLDNDGGYTSSFDGPFGWRIFEAIIRPPGSSTYTREIVFNPTLEIYDSCEWKVVDMPAGEELTPGTVYTWSYTNDHPSVLDAADLNVATAGVTWPYLRNTSPGTNSRAGLCVRAISGAAILVLAGPVSCRFSGTGYTSGNELWVGPTGDVTTENPHVPNGIRIGTWSLSKKASANSNTSYLINVAFEQRQPWPGEQYVNYQTTPAFEAGKWYIKYSHTGDYQLADTSNLPLAVTLVKCLYASATRCVISKMVNGDKSLSTGDWLTFTAGVPSDVPTAGGLAAIDPLRNTVHQPPFPFVRDGDFLPDRVATVQRAESSSNPSVGQAVYKGGTNVTAADGTIGQEAFGVCEARLESDYVLIVEKGPTSVPLSANSVLMPTTTAGLIGTVSTTNGEYAYQWISNSVGDVDIRRRVCRQPLSGWTTITISEGAQANLEYEAFGYVGVSGSEQRSVRYAERREPNYAGYHPWRKWWGWNRQDLTLTDSRGDTVSMPYVNPTSGSQADFVSNAGRVSVSLSIDITTTPGLRVYTFTASGVFPVLVPSDWRSGCALCW